MKPKTCVNMKPIQDWKIFKNISSTSFEVNAFLSVFFFFWFVWELFASSTANNTLHVAALISLAIGTIGLALYADVAKKKRNQNKQQ